MRRRTVLAALGLAAVSVVTPLVSAAAYTTRQLVAACRLWLKRHHVRRYATVEILVGDGPPKETLLGQRDDSGNWRWAPHLSAWVGPAYNVSWNASVLAVPQTFFSPFEGQHVQVYVGDWTVEGQPALVDPVYAADRASAFGRLDTWSRACPVVGHTSGASGSGVAFLIQEQAVGHANLVPNYSFETVSAPTVPDLTYWSAVAGSISSDDGTNIPGPTSGGYSMQVDGTGSISVVSAIPFTTVGAPGIPVEGGAPYTVRADMFVRSTDVYTALPGITVAWYSSSGALIANAGGLVATDVATDAFWPVVATVTAPAEAVQMQIQFTATSTGAARFGVDSVEVRGGNPTDADPDQPQTQLDIRTILGTGITVGSTFTFPPEDVDGVGDDGDWYLDRPGKALYGPKDGGDWPDDPAVQGFKLTQLVR
jgi:hypothetical protein